MPYSATRPARPQNLDAYEAKQLAAVSDNEALNCAARIAASVCGADSCIISLFDLSTEYAIANYNWRHAKVVPRHESLPAHAVSTDIMLEVSDTHATTKYASFPLVSGPESYRFVAVHPLRTNQGYAIGAITVLSHLPMSLTLAQHSHLAGLALMIDGLLDTKRSAVAQAQVMRVLEEQREILINAARGNEIEDNLTYIVNHIEGHFVGMTGAILMVTEDHLRFRMGSEGGLADSLKSMINGVTVASRQIPDSLAVRGGSPLTIANLPADDAWAPLMPKFLELGIAAYWSFPIMASNGRPFGTLVSVFKEPRQITEAETEMLRTFTGVIATVIAQNNTRRKSVQERAIHLEAKDLTGFSTWSLDCHQKSWRLGGPILDVFDRDDHEPSMQSDAFFSCIVPADRERVRAEVEVAIEKRRPLRSDFRVMRADGQIRDVACRGTPKMDIDRTMQNLEGVMMDQTDLSRVKTMGQLRSVSND